MKEKLINNLGLKVLSIFLAFFVWLVVVNVSNPEVTRSREVTLEIENEQVLTAAQRTYEISGKNTVTVYFDVRTRDEYKVRATDFRAYVDLAELYDVTGSVQVKVEVLNNKEIISNAAARPGVVRVETEELQSKPFELRVELTGNTEAGYAVNGMTLLPEEVLVEGPVSQVGLISYAGVEINIDGLGSDSEGIVEPKFYDANGNSLTISDRITVKPLEIQYKLIVNRVKKLTLDFEVSGAVASGYQYTGVECDTKEVAVIGLKSTLASLNKIMISASDLSINGATGDRTVTVDLRKYLPEGVEIIETENPMVDVRLKVEQLENRTITLRENDIVRENPNENYRYRLMPGRIEVTIQGLGEDLDSLQESDLGASVDLAGMQPGSQEGSLTFTESSVFRILSYSDFTVEVEGNQGSGMTEGESSVDGPDGHMESGTSEDETDGSETSEARETTEAASQAG